MSTSPIESFIRSEDHGSMEPAFEAFMQTPRIKSWVANNPNRVRRLREEFERVWRLVHEDAGGNGADAGPVTPTRAADTMTSERPRRLPAGRTVMCPNCRSLDLRAKRSGGVMGVKCMRCDREYGDLLECIPVRPVGPFALMFGDGWRGAANAGGLAGLLVLLYGVLRWLL